MPNWCYTHYTIEGESKELKTFYDLIKELDNKVVPDIKNDFGTLWLGSIVNRLGADWKTVCCRGKISDYQFTDNSLMISTSTAWTEMAEWRNFIKSKFPSFKFFFMSEEDGNEYYVTNDNKGKYYSYRYYLDDAESGSKYFETLKEACDYVSSLTGHKATDLLEIQNAIDAFNAQQEDDCVSFHSFRILDD